MSGNVDESYANELLVAFEYSPTIPAASHKVMLTSLTAQPDPDRPFVLNGSRSLFPQKMIHTHTFIYTYIYPFRTSKERENLFRIS
jgi:hypothetical protein